MLRYVVIRILQVIPVLILVSFAVFVMIRLIPGDPVAILLGEDVSYEVVIATRERLGLDQPVLKQYVFWVKDVINGDFGESFSYKQPVMGMISDRLRATLILATGAIVIAVLFGLSFGIVAAVWHNKPIDYLITTISMLAISTPGYFFAMLMVLLFAVKLGLMPSVGLKTPKHYILPMLTLGFQQIGMMTRMTRATMLEVLNQDFIRTAKASGVPQSVILFKNALKNTLVPLTTIVALRFGGLLIGAVLIEKVFSIHGLGMLLVEAINYRDYPVIQACILSFSLIFILVTLIADLLYGVVDPRVSIEKSV